MLHILTNSPKILYIPILKTDITKQVKTLSRKPKVNSGEDIL